MFLLSTDIVNNQISLLHIVTRNHVEKWADLRSVYVYQALLHREPGDEASFTLGNRGELAPKIDST